MKHCTLFCLPILFLPTWLGAQSLTINSPESQTTLIELYSSEGCHSCPPADQFISQFSQSETLWQTYIPLVFHVDYWDYLGWQDPYASPAYSNRQRQFKQQGLLSSVYTPGFMVNGLEWTGFFKAWRSLPETEQKPGSLQVTIKEQHAVVYFDSSKQLTFHLAIVGNGLRSSVDAGENQGKQLLHDFVVLDHQSSSGLQAVHFQLPLIHRHQPERLALISWVTADGDMQPLQAAGGWLPDGLIRVL